MNLTAECPAAPGLSLVLGEPVSGGDTELVGAISKGLLVDVVATSGGAVLVPHQVDTVVEVLVTVSRVQYLDRRWRNGW